MHCPTRRSASPFRDLLLGSLTVAAVALTSACAPQTPTPIATTVPSATPDAAPSATPTSTVAALVATAPTVVAPVATPVPTEPAAPIARSHTVEPGESLVQLAAQFGVSTSTLRAANEMDDADLLAIGQELRIPAVDGVFHTVQPGENVRTIADSYAVEVPELLEVNHLASAPDLLLVGTELLVPGPELAEKQQARSAATTEQRAASAPAAPAAPAAPPRTYLVQDGDTLRSIAERFGVDILSLVAGNGLDDADVIRPGSTLAISTVRSREHVVEVGETLADIAFQYNIPVSRLLEANAFEDPDLVHVGTPLIVPAEQGAVAAQPRPTPTSAPAPAAPAPQAPQAPQAPRPTATPVPRPAPTAVPVEMSEEGQVITAKVTGYAPGAGASSNRTASGAITVWGTVAADTRLYPFGTRLKIEGFGDQVFIVQDRGSAVVGNIFDVWFPDAATARQFGSQTRRVTILGR